jgi:hypothetical protein
MKAMDYKILGIKCDAPGCDFKDPTVSFDNYKLWLNKPCPKCGANLLTQADYDTCLYIIKIARILNTPGIKHIYILFNFLFGRRKLIKFKGEMNGTGEVNFKPQE